MCIRDSINTVTQITDTPKRISIAVNKANHTHDLIMNSGVFNVSVLTTDATFALFQRFGFQSGREVDKFDGFADVARSENGLYYVTQASNAFISGKVIQTLDYGKMCIRDRFRIVQLRSAESFSRISPPAVGAQVPFSTSAMVRFCRLCATMSLSRFSMLTKMPAL